MDISALEKAVELCGSQAALARKVGVSPQAIQKWKKRVPAERVLDIEEATGGVVTRYDLRSDLYREAPPLNGNGGA